MDGSFSDPFDDSQFGAYSNQGNGVEPGDMEKPQSNAAANVPVRKVEGMLR